MKEPKTLEEAMEMDREVERKRMHQLIILNCITLIILGISSTLTLLGII